MKKRIILQKEIGCLEYLKELPKFIKSLGYNVDKLTLEIRLDERIIKYISDRVDKYGNYIENVCSSVLTVGEVDLNKKWFINIDANEYIASENICYLKLEDKELNYYEVEYK